MTLSQTKLPFFPKEVAGWIWFVLGGISELIVALVVMTITVLEVSHSGRVHQHLLLILGSFVVAFWVMYCVGHYLVSDARTHADPRGLYGSVIIAGPRSYFPRGVMVTTMVVVVPLILWVLVDRLL